MIEGARRWVSCIGFCFISQALPPALSGAESGEGKDKKAPLDKAIDEATHHDGIQESEERAIDFLRKNGAEGWGMMLTGIVKTDEDMLKLREAIEMTPVTCKSVPGYRVYLHCGRGELYVAAVPDDFGKTGRRTFVVALETTRAGVLYEASGQKEAVKPVWDYLEEDGGKGEPGSPFVVCHGRGERLEKGESDELPVVRKIVESRIQVNELSAIKGLRACLEAGVIYKKLRCDNGKYPASIEAMKDGHGNALISLATTGGVSHGYRYEVHRGSNPQSEDWYVTAIPENFGETGRRTFVADVSTGIIYAAEGERVPAKPVVGYLPGVPPAPFVVLEE